MKISEPTYEQCDCCNQRGKMIADAVYGCDHCGKVFFDGSLRATIFCNDGKSPLEVDCCSWGCMLKKLATVETDYFVSMPFLHFDNERPEGQRAGDFFAAIKCADNRER